MFISATATVTTNALAMELMIYKFEYSDDPVRLEEQIQRLTEAIGCIRKGVQMLLDLDSCAPRVLSVKRGILRVLGPYEELLQQKVQVLTRVSKRTARVRRRRRVAK